MKKQGMAIWMAAAMLSMAAPAFTQSDNRAGQGQAVVTILPKQHGESLAAVSTQDVNVKVNGNESSVTEWVPLRGAADWLELVLLIDGAARNLAQFGEITQFIQGLSPHTKVAIGYMQNGSAVLAGSLSADHAQVLHGLHIPGGGAGSSIGPYFCLSDLAKHWPSAERGVRREVVLVTDGVDAYDRRYDPEDPYVQAAIDDSARAGLVVYSIYWSSQTAGSFSGEGFAGQSLLQIVTQATGGNSYGLGTGNPVSFQPYFEDLARRLENQYRLGFAAQLDRKPAVESLKLKVGGMAASVTAPEWVFVDHAGATAK